MKLREWTWKQTLSATIVSIASIFAVTGACLGAEPTAVPLDFNVVAEAPDCKLQWTNPETCTDCVSVSIKYSTDGDSWTSYDSINYPTAYYGPGLGGTNCTDQRYWGVSYYSATPPAVPTSNIYCYPDECPAEENPTATSTTETILATTNEMLMNQTLGIAIIEWAIYFALACWFFKPNYGRN